MSDELRWVVAPGDGATVGQVLGRAGVDLQAVNEGRVFLGRTRIGSESHPARVGDILVVSALRAPGAAWHWIHRSPDIVAVDKPAGMPTIADASGRAHSLQAQVAKSLRVLPEMLHPTSRLDLEVSGVVTFAVTKKGRESLARLRVEGLYERRYVAIGRGRGSELSGKWTNRIGRARDPKLRMIDGRDPTDAETHFALVSVVHDFALLALAPVTGRTHQLRVHAAHAALPLLGDRAYGGPMRETLSDGRVLRFDRIALHAARVALAGDNPLILSAPVPPRLRAWWDALGGEPSAWDQALAHVFAP
jgi:23S rRNA-/tRNA-specific pseudouridylate synthase